MNDDLPQLFRPLNAIIKGFSISTKTKSKAKLFLLKMNVVVVRRSKKRDKKFDALFPDGKTISFGAKGYEDYTMHGDK
jgi:hypothetical protein